MGRDRRSVRRLTACLIALVALLLAGSSALAQSQEDKDRARRHFDRGEAFRQAGAHDKAAEEYEAAYQIVARPALLFNIGLAHENAGNAAKAVDYYGRFLASNPEGTVADEALARKVQLERRLAAEREAERARGEASAAEAARKREAAKQREAAAAAIAKKAYADAIRAYEAAYELDRDPELLFDMGEALRASGERKRALTTFERYRREAPSGPRAGDAVERVAALEREIALTARGARPASPAALTRPAPRAERAPPRRGRSRVLWLGLAAAAIGAGVALDVVPGSASNGEVDGLDFAPLGLYAVGGVFAFRGVF